jgi:hypothetical protein
MKRTSTRERAAGAACDVPLTSRPPVEEVSQRARDIWMARGQPQGCDEDIWYEAERQIAAETRSGMPPLEKRGVPISAEGLEARVDEVLAHHTPPERRASPTSLQP